MTATRNVPATMFDKIIFSREEMISRKLSKKSITKQDWKIINYILNSYADPVDSSKIRQIAFNSYFSNAINRWNTEDKIYQAYIWGVENGYVSLDSTKIFIRKVNSELFIDGASRALALDVDAYHKLLLKFAISKYEGKYEEALSYLEKLNSEAKDLEQKRFYANSQRSIFHILKDRWRMAENGLAYLKNNPNIVDMGYCFHIANCAGYSNHFEALSYAVSRIFKDIIVLLKDDDLFSIEYVAAFETSLKLFGLKYAEAIVKKASALGLARARDIQGRFDELLSDIDGWRWAVDLALDRVKEIGNGSIDSKTLKDAESIVVLSSAAFSYNKIDYPNFRNSIRKVYSEIFQSLKVIGVKASIDVKFGTHGIIYYPVPFFSYHTISNSENGLHFKETDRRHCFSFDGKGYSGWSDFSSKKDLGAMGSCSLKTNSDFYEDDYINNIVSGVSKYKQPDGVQEVLPEKYILVALQLEADAVNQLAFMSFERMVGIVVRNASAVGLGVVIKRHPYCNSSNISKLLNGLEGQNGVVISRGNIKHLIDKSIGVSVVNSSVGAEALLERKPVYVFGASEYMAACHVCNDDNDFAVALELNRPKLNDEEFMSFWYSFRNQYSFDVRDHSASEKITGIVAKFLGRKLPEATNDIPKIISRSH